MSRARTIANRNEILALVGYDACISEIERGLLYLVSVPDRVCARWSSISSSAAEQYIVFCIDDDPDFAYRPFLNDFGPNDLATVHAFCTKIKIWLDTGYLRPDNTIIMLTSYINKRQQLNSTFLLCASAILLLGKTPIQLKDSLEHSQSGIRCQEKRGSTFTTFTDVFGGANPFRLTLWNCVSAFYKAVKLRFYDYYQFDEAEYIFYEQVEYGDLNWIIPEKILAFSGPSSEPNYSDGRWCHSPEFYRDYFTQHNVKLVIRLNNPEYDAEKFEKMGIKHADLIFPDGCAPTRALCEKFFKLVEETDGAIAIHCQAGIGRTGTLIAAYIMKHYMFTAAEAIAWTRICRPGSVIGHQQNWLRLSRDWIQRAPLKSSPKSEIRARIVRPTQNGKINGAQDSTKHVRYDLRRFKEVDDALRFEGCIEELDETPIEWVVERHNHSEIYYPKVCLTKEENVPTNDKTTTSKVDEMRRFEVNQARELLRSKMALRKTSHDRDDCDGDSENLLNPVEWPLRTLDQIDEFEYEKSVQKGVLPLDLGKSMPRMIVTGNSKIVFIHKLAKTDVYYMAEIADRKTWMTVTDRTKCDTTLKKANNIKEFEILRRWPVKIPEGTFLSYKIGQRILNANAPEIHATHGRHEIMNLYSDLQKPKPKRLD